MTPKEESRQVALKTLRHCRGKVVRQMTVTTDGIEVKDKAYVPVDTLKFHTFLNGQTVWALQFGNNGFTAARLIHTPAAPEQLKLNPKWCKKTQQGKVLVMFVEGEHHEAEMAARKQLQEFMLAERDSITGQINRNMAKLVGIESKGEK